MTKMSCPFLHLICILKEEEKTDLQTCIINTLGIYNPHMYLDRGGGGGGGKAIKYIY